MVGDEQPRLAKLTDLSDIEQVVTASYAKYLPRVDKPPAPLERDYAEAIENGQVWIVGDPVQGLVVLINQSEAALLIENIAVHPDTQGSGLGRRLMEFAESQATARGLSRLALYTNEAMFENLPLYEHLGFVEVDRRTEDGHRRIFMEKSL
jgi:GNAT superfamily N-acetyltransferase